MVPEPTPYVPKAPPAVGWDIETHLIEPGNLTPTPVCITFAGVGGLSTLVEALPKVRIIPTPILRGPEWAAIYALPDRRAVDAALGALRALVEEGIVVVAHNGQFDWCALVAHSSYSHDRAVFDLVETGRVRDTRVREQLIAIAEDRFTFDPRLKTAPTFSLAQLVMRYHNTDISESKKDPNAWRLRYSELSGVSLDRWPVEALRYAMDDAVWTRRIYLDQSTPLSFPEGEVVDTLGRVTDEVQQFAAALALHLMAVQGVYTDAYAVQAYRLDNEALAAASETLAVEAGFRRVNRCRKCDGTGWLGDPPHLTRCGACGGVDHEHAPPAVRGRGKSAFKPSTSKKRLQAWVEHAYGGDAPRTPPSNTFPEGQVKVDEDALAGCGIPRLVQYSEGLKAIKRMERTVPLLERGVNRPITSSPQVLVRSGRTSWRDPNLQNPERGGDFRACFVPREGNVFVSIDYSQIEMCTLAEVCLHLFGYSRMADALQAGQDLHTLFAADILGISYEEALKGKIEGDKDILQARQDAKMGNFGFPGGLGASTFVEYAKGFGVDVTFNRASDLRTAWLRKWPEMEDYFRMIGRAVEASPSGRIRVRQPSSGRIRGGCSYTSAANTYFQGWAADGAKAALWALAREMYAGDEDGENVLAGVHAWAFIHDEVLFEGPADTVHIWAPHAAQIMVREMQAYCPHVPVQAAPAVMTRWYKKASPVFVGPERRLSPWFPGMKGDEVVFETEEAYIQAILANLEDR